MNGSRLIICLHNSPDFSMTAWCSLTTPPATSITHISPLIAPTVLKQGSQSPSGSNTVGCVNYHQIQIQWTIIESGTENHSIETQFRKQKQRVTLGLILKNACVFKTYFRFYSKQNQELVFCYCCRTEVLASASCSNFHVTFTTVTLDVEQHKFSVQETS